jgi:hypothetical protein
MMRELTLAIPTDNRAGGQIGKRIGRFEMITQAPWRSTFQPLRSLTYWSFAKKKGALEKRFRILQSLKASNSLC